MASAITTATEELQDSFLSAIRKSQDITLHAIKVWVDTVESFTPTVSYAHLPFVGRLPNAYNVVASSFDFAEHVLASQRRFTDDVLKVTSPLLPGEEGAAPPAVRSPRPRTAPEAGNRPSGA
jgi:hypothetical protein